MGPPDPYVRLDRDPVVEEQLRRQFSTAPASCFLCASPAPPLADGAKDEVTTFKRIFMTAPFRAKISPRTYNHFTKNATCCLSCGKFVRNVVALDDELVAIGRRLRKKLDEGRKNMVKREKGRNVATPPRPIEVKDEPGDDDLVPVYDSDFDPGDDGESSFGEASLAVDAISEKATKSSPRAKRKRRKNVDLDDSDEEKMHDSEEDSNYVPDGDATQERVKRRQPVRKDGDLGCAKCGKKFGYRRGLLRHEIEVCRVPHNKSTLAGNDITLHPCQTCDRVFLSVKMMMRHAQSHTGSKKASSSASLLPPKTEMSAQKPGQNSDSDTDDDDAIRSKPDEPLETGNGVDEHKVTSTFKRGVNLSCTKCGKKGFNKRSGLIRHEIQTCGVVYSKTALKEMNIKLYPCTRCDRVYVSRPVMMAHAKSHTGNMKLLPRSKNKRTKTDSEYEDDDTQIPKTHQAIRLTCTICRKRFETKLRRIRHEIKVCHVTYTPEEMAKLNVSLYPCQGCDKVFIYKRDLDRHSKSKNHPVAAKVPASSSSPNYEKFATLFCKPDQDLDCDVTPKPYSLGSHPCQKCGKVCATLMSKVYHEIKLCKVEYDPDYLKKIKLTLLSCDRCDQKFHFKRDLDKHVLTHSNPVKYSCSSCGKNFRHLESFKIHTAIRCTHPTMKLTPKEQQVLTAKTSKKCPQCPVRLSSNSGLYRHIATVHNPSRVIEKGTGPISGTICEFCGKSFSPGVFRKHMRRMHNNERAHVCPTCKKRFLGEDELKAHLCAEEDKKWKCSECEATFDYPSRLNDHENMVHRKITRYECDLCDRKFFKLGGLNKHVKRHREGKKVRLSAQKKREKKKGGRAKKRVNLQETRDVEFMGNDDTIFEVDNEVEII